MSFLDTAFAVVAVVSGSFLTLVVCCDLVLEVWSNKNE